MLSKLTAGDISKNYDWIKNAIKDSVPNHIELTDEGMINIMKSLAVGGMEAWTIYSLDNDVQNIKVLMITMITFDDIFDQNNLLIYSIKGFESLSMKEWRDSLDSLMVYGRSRKISNITAFTNIDRVIKIVNELGGNTDTKFITIPIKQVEVLDA